MYKYEFLKDFVMQVFIKTGCTGEDAEKGAEILLAADLRGIPSHGVLRLKDYLNLWEHKRINCRPNVSIVHETPSTAVVNGDNGFGIMVAPKAMKIAIEKARNFGTGWVSMNNSNHFGIAGYYSMMALEYDMIGIAMTNANPLVAPTFSVDRLLGTNPIAVAIPALNQPSFVADFATTPIARGKLDVLHRKGEKAPFGFVQDIHGKPSDNPNILTEGGAILPLGGDKEHGSHKGYCLGSIVDIFSSILSGANFGPFVPPSVAYLPVLPGSTGKGTGHFFGAIRIDAFQPAEEFKKSMDKWIETFRKARPVEGQEKVLIPGDPEREKEEAYRKEGIPLLESVIMELETIAQKFDLKFENL
jgi:L-2-hydroxycarboxylate dehydrogenase (NAD+)